MESYDVCEKYFQDHAQEIVELILQDCEEEKDELRFAALDTLKKYITPVPPHYNLEGEKLNQNGLIDLNQTVDSFLRSEYIPPFFAGKDASWWEWQCAEFCRKKPTYEELFRFEVHNLIFEIVEKRIESILRSNFPDYAGTGLYLLLFSRVHTIAPIRLFYFWDAIEFLEIGDVILKDLK